MGRVNYNVLNNTTHLKTDLWHVQLHNLAMLVKQDLVLNNMILTTLILVGEALSRTVRKGPNSD